MHNVTGVVSAVLVVLVVMLTPASARGQACCAGGATLTPARLERHEWLLIGSQLQAKRLIGSFGSDGRFYNQAPGTSQWDFEQNVFSSVRLTERGQAAVLLPFAFSRRSAPGVGTEVGGGFGDVQFSLRWDALFAGERRPIPGVAALAALRLPTGTPPEYADKVLGTDATGGGATQLAAGIVLEEYSGPWLFNVMTNLTYHFARRVPGFSSQRGVQVRGLASAGYALNHQWVTAFIASLTTERATKLDGQAVPMSDRRSMNLSLATTYSPNNDWRVRAGVYVIPAVSGLGKNELAAVGANVALIRGFY